MMRKRSRADGILKISERFIDEGCDDVAWQITKIAPEDIDAEITTESFPVDLFISDREDDADETIMPEGMRAFLGSDAFLEVV